LTFHTLCPSYVYCPLLSGLQPGDRVQFANVPGTIERDQTGIWIREDQGGRILLNQRVTREVKRLTASPPAPQTSAPQPPSGKPSKRFSAPGHASGWLETRQGNKKRKTPSISHYYCWDTRDTNGKPKRRKLYIPTGKVATVQQMVTDRRPIEDIVQVLTTKP
jgi:hypothetical protein